MLLIVVEDRQAEAALRIAIGSARARGAPFVVLTADALLMMQLARDGIDARLTLHAFTGTTDASRADAGGPAAAVDEGDRAALDGAAAAAGAYARFDGTDFAPYFEYTLIPSFVRAVRNVTAVQRVAASVAAERLLLVGGGALVQAAQLVAARRAIPVERAAGDVVTRALHAIARVRAGRATRWVNTEFRALVLEPGFLAVLYLKGLWRRVVGPPVPAVQPDAIIVVGDRFTADVIARLRGDARQIVLAGATQPGRALFDATASLVPIETLAHGRIVLRTLATLVDATPRAAALAADDAHGRAFVVGDVGYWPLVRRTSALHVMIWSPLLRHLEQLAAAAAQAAPRGRVLTPNDVTEYNRFLVDTARRVGVASVGIQHGITAEPNGHSVARVDTLATWGEQAEEWYRAEGRKRGCEQTARFVVTGNPRYDTLASSGLQTPPPRSLAGPASDGAGSSQPEAAGAEPPFSVCICTGFVTDFSMGSSDYENLLMIDTVLAWARAHRGVRVVHKIHPGEELAFYAQAARALAWDPQTLTTIAEPILHEVLRRSHVLVSAYSSTVLESLALGTPVVIFDAITQRRLVHTPLHSVADVPGVRIAFSSAEVGGLLDAIRTGPAPDRDRLRSSIELRAFISNLDGEAAARVAALVR
jgi:hypothetical protein